MVQIKRTLNVINKRNENQNFHYISLLFSDAILSFSPWPSPSNSFLTNPSKSSTCMNENHKPIIKETHFQSYFAPILHFPSCLESTQKTPHFYSSNPPIACTKFSWESSFGCLETEVRWIKPSLFILFFLFHAKPWDPKRWKIKGFYKLNGLKKKKMILNHMGGINKSFLGMTYDNNMSKA